MAEKSVKLTDELKLEIRQKFVEGFEVEGKMHYPSLDELVGMYNLPRTTVYRRAKSEEWQRAKNVHHTKLQEAQEAARRELLVEQSRSLDNNSLKVAQLIIAEAGKLVNDSRTNAIKRLTAGELSQVSVAASNAQRIGKLALGEAQEISKVSANVGLPDSFGEIIRELEELAERKSQGGSHTLN